MPRKGRTKFTQEEYDAPLSLARHEKESILMAWLKCNGKRSVMALALHISIKDLTARIWMHNLEDVLGAPDCKKTVLQELVALEKVNIREFLYA